MTRRPFNRAEAEPFNWGPADHAALTATTTIKLFKVPAGRTLEITDVEYINVTGLAEDNDNNFAGALKNGSTVIATLFNTDANLDPDTGASLAANTFVAGTLSATEANRWVAAGDTVSLVFTETGTATLPAGILTRVRGYLY